MEKEYRKCEKRLTTTKENTRQVTTPSVNYSRPTATGWNCNCLALQIVFTIIHKNYIQIYTHANFLRQNGIRQNGIRQKGIRQNGINQRV